MFYIIVAAMGFWLIFDYKKDKKIEKRLRKEKEKAQNNCLEKE